MPNMPAGDANIVNKCYVSNLGSGVGIRITNTNTFVFKDPVNTGSFEGTVIGIALDTSGVSAPRTCYILTVRLGAMTGTPRYNGFYLRYLLGQTSTAQNEIEFWYENGGGSFELMGTVRIGASNGIVSKNTDTMTTCPF
jgi:hypothetical protein